MSLEHLDVLIVGAGLSGIGAAHHLQANCPRKTYAILEAREAIGGTWDLFRYPGIRSDSDMYTLGYRFRPWKDAQVDRRRAGDPRLRARDRPRGRHRPQDPLPASRAAAPSGRPPRRAGRCEARAQRHRRDRRAELRLPAHVQRLLPLRRGLHAGLRGDGALRRAHRAPAAVERGHRLRGQARGRDRQRRDRRDAGAGDGSARGARHDAAALAELRRSRCPARIRSPTPCAARFRRRSPIRSCAGRTCCWRCFSTSSADAGPS